MGDEFNLALCDEKHRNVRENQQEMRTDINNLGNIVRESTDALHKKLNWFYVIAISTLIGVVVSLAKSIAVKGGA